MTWAIPTPVLLELHVALSLLGILTGLIVVFGMLNGRHLANWSAPFLATTFLTGVTGFPLAPFGKRSPGEPGSNLVEIAARKRPFAGNCAGRSRSAD